MKLSVLGGAPVREKPFPRHNTIGCEEKKAVETVLDSGILSKFLGCWHPDFYGGHQVRALETEWAKYFGVRHAVAVNSCTSGLYCAVGATGVEPGDEIIVSPYTMCASATAPLIFNAIPIFADIDPVTFCIDPVSIESRITSRTKAIIAVDLFGHPYDAARVNGIARRHGLIVIEDTAQAPGAMAMNRFAGTLGDIGIFSLNYHKHIHCGEGGMVVTNNDDLADKVRLIRNHAEGVIEAKGVTELVNMIGFNFRMTEIEAAIARCQLEKLAGLLSIRRHNVAYLEEKLADIPAIEIPEVQQGCKHAYYIHACKFHENIAGISRNRFIEAVCAELPVFEGREAEGVKIGCGYVKPLYMQPLFQKRTAYGSKGYPFSAHSGRLNYDKKSCPVAELMDERTLFTHEMMLPSMTDADLDDVIKAFHKVWDHRAQLM